MVPRRGFAPSCCLHIRPVSRLLWGEKMAGGRAGGERGCRRYHPFRRGEHRPAFPVRGRLSQLSQTASDSLTSRGRTPGHGPGSRGAGAPACSVAVFLQAYRPHPRAPPGQGARRLRREGVCGASNRVTQPRRRNTFDLTLSPAPLVSPAPPRPAARFLCTLAAGCLAGARRPRSIWSFPRRRRSSLTKTPSRITTRLP